MNTIITNLLLNLLGRVLTPDLVKKYETQLIAFVTAELTNAPELLHEAEKAVVCKLFNLAKAGGNPVTEELVQIAAAALSVDTSTCPA